MWKPLSQYWHTLSHLRPQQIVGQLWNRTGRPLRKQAFSRRPPAGPFPGTRWTPTPNWPSPVHKDTRLSQPETGHFCFINEHEQLQWPPQWQQADKTSKLWQYNLHYFDWLWLLTPEQAQQVACSWIHFSETQPFHVGWDPYPTSLRMLNWCGLFFGRDGQRTSANPTWQTALWESIYDQMEWLSLHIEYHLMGNHLFENAVALSLVGAGFHGPHAKRWRDKGITILQQELAEQFPQDGLHFERSPIYHLRLLYLLHLLHEQGDAELQHLASQYLPRMHRALQRMCHPDGRISLFNDSAFGIYHPASTLLDWTRYAASETPAPTSTWTLPDAGYYGATNDAGDAIIYDAGALGPDYIPGHAHADIFSFELSLRGHRIIVDSGVSDYLSGPSRHYCRSTHAHNTVEIEGHDQAQMWGAFRVAQRGAPRDIQWSSNEQGFSLSAWHDGYPSQGIHATHSRTARWFHSGKIMLEVEDTIHSKQAVTTRSRLHFHPQCSIREQTERQLLLDTPAGPCRILWWGQGTLQVDPESWYCPRFGETSPNPCVAFVSHGTTQTQGFTIMRE